MKIGEREVPLEMRGDGTLVINANCRECDGSGVKRRDGKRGTPCINPHCTKGMVVLEIQPYYGLVRRTDIETVHSRSWTAHKRDPRLVPEGVPYDTWNPGDQLPNDIPAHLKSGK